MMLVGAIVRLAGPAPAVAAKLMAVPPVPMIVPALNTLPFVGAPNPAPASRNTMPIRPEIVPPLLLTIVALLPTRTPERAVPAIAPELVSVVVFCVLTPSNAPESVAELLMMAVVVAIAIPLVLVALIVAPALLVTFANPTAPGARMPTPPTSVPWMLWPVLLVIVRLSPDTPLLSPVIVPEFTTVATVALTPDETAPIPWTAPKFVKVLRVDVPPKDTPMPPCTLPPDCTVTSTVPAAPAVVIPVPVFSALTVLVPLMLILILPVPELPMLRASPPPVLVMLP